MQPPPLALYIHLPWCERKCPYCDFNSHEATELPEEQYVEALLQDLRSDLELVQGRTVETLFIGGGTPSLFSVAAIDKLLQGIGSMLELAPDLEATMEANPGSAEAGKFKGFREAGITRLSLGVQSFDDGCLQALGRVHNSAQALQAVAHARAADFTSFNLDLMHGLPGQDSAAALTDLETAISCAAPHLSWYQLTIEPNTVFFKQPPTLPEEDELAAIQRQGEELLAAAGYQQYEVSAYSLAGFECGHNLNYWSFGDYLGIGAGAHGKVSFPDGRIERYAKRRQPGDYLAAGAGACTASRYRVSPADIAGEFMLNALRLNGGFSLAQFTARTGLAVDEVRAQLEHCRQQGLLEIADDRVKTSALGRRFLDTVVAGFFPAPGEGFSRG